MSSPSRSWICGANVTCCSLICGTSRKRTSHHLSFPGFVGHPDQRGRYKVRHIYVSSSSSSRICGPGVTCWHPDLWNIRYPRTTQTGQATHSTSHLPSRCRVHPPHHSSRCRHCVCGAGMTYCHRDPAFRIPLRNMSRFRKLH